MLSGVYPDLVQPTLITNKASLARTISIAHRTHTDAKLRTLITDMWDDSAYRPVPTIIEAAEALYAGHDVAAIAHSQAGNENLDETANRVFAQVRRAEKRKEKIACFITGIPGAGKTLAGLNIAHNRSIQGSNRVPSVFLSGNGPLVKVIRKAIERDFKERRGEGNVQRTSGTFIQNIHTFIKFNLKPLRVPHENVIIFDEAQRAWNVTQVARKYEDLGEHRSEPEMVLSIMDRHEWAVVVALVGGGQEIHKGEAGLAEWGSTLQKKFPRWKIAASHQALIGDTSIAGRRLFEQEPPKTVIKEPSLHLNISRRSYRAEQITEWVEAVLRADAASAAKIARELRTFPLKLTRSLQIARKWLHQQARGLRRAGLVASSGGIRLRAEGLELSSAFRRPGDMYVNWFLKDSPDVRSSNQLEVAASEFECQGLELDWVGVCWSGDFTYNGQGSERCNFRAFRGDQWNRVSGQVERQYLINKYRVLLTRAREGMIIWIPEGELSDLTRPCEWFDLTAEFLRKCGLELLQGFDTLRNQ